MYLKYQQHNEQNLKKCVMLLSVSRGIISIMKLNELNKLVCYMISHIYLVPRGNYEWYVYILLSLPGQVTWYKRLLKDQVNHDSKK